MKPWIAFSRLEFTIVVIQLIGIGLVIGLLVLRGGPEGLAAG